MFTTILVQPLFNILFALYALIPGHDFGVAVIGLTIIVRLILWPLVTKQLHSQKAMQKLQPEIARIRKEAAGDRQKETAQLMELYKERGTSPFASLLPILLQFPILIALVQVFNNSLHPDKIANWTYGFVQHLPVVADIVNHHATFNPTLFGAIDLTKPFWGFALAAGAAQYFQARQLQPKPEHMDDQAKMMSMMTFIFPVVTVLFALKFPAALALYWTITSLMAVLQQYLVLHRDAEEMEEAAEAAEAATVTKVVTKPAPAAQPTTKKRTKSKRTKTQKGGAR